MLWSCSSAFQPGVNSKWPASYSFTDRRNSKLKLSPPSDYAFPSGASPWPRRGQPPVSLSAFSTGAPQPCRLCCNSSGHGVVSPRCLFRTSHNSLSTCTKYLLLDVTLTCRQLRPGQLQLVYCYSQSNLSQCNYNLRSQIVIFGSVLKLQINGLLAPPGKRELIVRLSTINGRLPRSAATVVLLPGVVQAVQRSDRGKSPYVKASSNWSDSAGFWPNPRPILIRLDRPLAILTLSPWGSCPTGQLPLPSGERSPSPLVVVVQLASDLAADVRPPNRPGGRFKRVGCGMRFQLQGIGRERVLRRSWCCSWCGLGSSVELVRESSDRNVLALRGWRSHGAD